MFSKKSKSESSSHFKPGSTTLVAQGTRFQGELLFKGNLEIEGSVTGNIIAEDEASRLRILAGGSVQGEVRVPTVVVNGNVEGEIYAGRSLELGSKAVIEGNVHYRVIEIEKGAHVAGSFVHDGSEEFNSAKISSFPKEQVALG